MQIASAAINGAITILLVAMCGVAHVLGTTQRVRSPMLNGRVINIVRLVDSTWVQCLDVSRSENDAWGIYVKDPLEMRVGDSLWMQNDTAYWTPDDGSMRRDIPLEKIGFSCTKIPDEVLDLVDTENF